MEEDKKWYYVEYGIWGLEQEFYASSPEEAEQMALNEFENVGVDIVVEEMED